MPTVGVWVIISYKSLGLGMGSLRAQLHFELEEPVHGDGQSDILGLGTPIDVPIDVHLSVLQYFANHISGGDALGALGGLEFAQFLHKCIAILALGSLVGNVIVADEVNFVFVQEI